MKIYVIEDWQSGYVSVKSVTQTLYKSIRMCRDICVSKEEAQTRYNEYWITKKNNWREQKEKMEWARKVDDADYFDRRLTEHKSKPGQIKVKET